ncbi:MAG: NUDIX hydrolase [Clostridiales bacterium]|nr:NUDIX hydrolase [Clostridiales bacterium]
MKIDLLFKNDEFVFSYRVTGLLIHNDEILLQKPEKDRGYSLPGGHAVCMEPSQKALIREFKEELNIDIVVNKLKAIGEIFFMWGSRPCHQINLYYSVKITDNTFNKLKSNKLFCLDEAGKEYNNLTFHWHKIQELDKIVLYPQEIVPIIKNKSDFPTYFFSDQIH